MMMLAAGTPRKYLLRLVGGVGLVAVLFLADILFCRRAAGRCRCRITSATG